MTKDFVVGYNAALDDIAASMEKELRQSEDSVAPPEHKGGVNSALTWAIAEANRLKRSE